jgi:hypothetical protein
MFNLVHPATRPAAYRLSAALTSLTTLTIVLAAPACGRAQSERGEWVALFDGQTLQGWESWDAKGKADPAKNWKVEEGAIHGFGEVAHLFSERGDYENFHLRAEIKIADKGNSGMYFRTQKGPGFPEGYEAQINSTGRDPVKTGSLYNRVLIKEILVPADEWFTYEVIAKGNHFTVILNGKTLYEYVDRANQYPKGHIAFQQHDPGSHVWIRKVEIMEFPQ